MLPGFLRTARYILSVVLTLGVGIGAAGFTWYASERTTKAQQVAAIQRADGVVSGLAVNYSEQIGRQILALDQSLDNIARDYDADPGRFNLETERKRERILTGISRDMFMADENGFIRQASVSDFLGQNVGNLEAFRDAAEHNSDKPKLYLGGAAVNPIMRQWHLDAARTLHKPDGSFAGIIDADYRVSAINEVFASASPPGNGFAALINLTEGKMRVAFGAVAATPDASIADTPMFGAVDATESGIWTGPSATDAVVRIHAIRRIADRDLAVIAGVDEQEVLQPVAVWRWQTRLFAGAVTVLLAMVCLLLMNGLRAGRGRFIKDREIQAQFAATNALSEVARAQSDAVGRRLQATFSAVTEGVAIFDPHLNLVEWNGLFPERSGVNASFIRTGMPMEDVLRTQAQNGYFGVVEDVEAEVDRRTMLLRAGNFGASLSFQAHDRSIELRCRPLPEGGFVALYTDVTEGRRARQALRDAREALAREQSSRLRFLDVIAFELRARVTTLMRSLARLRDMEPAPAQLQVIERVHGIGESMASLATDAIEVPLMEAGGPVLRPALIAVPALLRDVVDMLQPAAQERGITVYLVVNEAAPAELIADPDRVRQIVILLLSEAVRTAAPDTMWLLADAGDNEGGDNEGGDNEGGDNDREALRLTIRELGAPLSDAARTALFPPINAVAVPEQSGTALAGTALAATRAGTSLGPAIAQYLARLMGGELRCEGWATIDGRTGNDLILSLPPELLPGQRGRAPGQAPAEGRPLPRTRVLLIGEETGLRMAAVTMLRRDGHMVDSVSTVEEAISVLDNAPYDVVFIDMELAGSKVEAAIRAIRDMIGPPRDMPLIVLAPPHEEREERTWRDAGADDVIASNPTLDDLGNAIGRNVWLSRTFVSGVGFMPGLEEDTEEGIPILAADRIAELQANIPPEDLLDMVEECISDLFRRLPALRRSLAAGAPGAITAQAHAMVGMAAGYGMAVLEARLRAIQNAVRAKRMDTIDGAAAVVESDLTRAAAALRRTLRFGQPAKSGAKT